MSISTQLSTPHSPKFPHYCNLTIRLFNVISRTLLGWSGVGCNSSAEKQSVYSTAPANWAILWKKTSGHTHVIQYLVKEDFIFSHFQFELRIHSNLCIILCLSNLWIITLSILSFFRNFFFFIQTYWQQIILKKDLFDQ